MITIYIKTIAIIIAFFCHQTAITMMVSHSLNIKQCNAVQNLLAYKIKHSQSFQEFYKKSYFKSVLSKFQYNNSNLSGLLKDEFYQKHQHAQKTNDITKFKRDIINFLLPRLLPKKKIPIQSVLKMFYDVEESQFKNNRSMHSDYCKLYKKKYKEYITMKESTLCPKLDFKHNEYESEDEYNIFKVIIEAVEKWDLKFIDFLINPKTVKFLSEYYPYNPNNIWKEFLKQPRVFMGPIDQEIKKIVKKRWNYFCNFHREPAIAELLIKYDYIENIPNFSYINQTTSKVIEVCSMDPLSIACTIKDEEIIRLLLKYAQKHLIIQAMKDKDNIPLIEKVLEQELKKEKDKFIEEIFSKVNSYYTECIGDKFYKKVNEQYGNPQDLEIFKKNVIEYLFCKKKISIELIINMLYGATENQLIDEKTDLIDFFFDNYKKKCTCSIKMHQPKLRDCWSSKSRKYKLKYDPDQDCKNEYESMEECIVLKTIIQTAKKNDFNVNDLNLIDFLIKPEIVTLLSTYYSYNPNNLWKEFLKEPTEYLNPHRFLKEFLDEHRINNKEKIAELLIKYNYLDDILKFSYVDKQSPDENGILYQCKHIGTYFPMSPLHVACRKNNATIFGLLLEHMKKNPNELSLAIDRLDGEEQPPIYYASRGDVKLINMLIEAGAECHTCPFVAIALLYKTIDTLDQLNCFNQLTKCKKTIFIQQQLYLLALTRPTYLVENIDTAYWPYKYLKYDHQLLNKKINKILDFFLLNGADFNKRNEIGELPIDIALWQYKLNIKIQEDFKKEKIEDWTVDYEQLYIFFAFSRKTDVINYGLLYLSLKGSIQEDILKTIMEFYYFLTFDIEKEIYRSYAQKYTPQDIDQKFKSNKSHKFAKQLHRAINNKINEEYKKLAKKPIGS